MNKTLQEIISATQIIGVRLVSIEAENNLHTTDGIPLKITFSPLPHKLDAVEDKLILMGGCKFHLFSENDDANPKSKVAIKMIFEAAYLVTDKSIESKDCKEFTQVNIPFNLWPYIREFVQSLSSKMLIEAPITLPLYRPASVPATFQTITRPVAKQLAKEKQKKQLNAAAKKDK